MIPDEVQTEVPWPTLVLCLSGVSPGRTPRGLLPIEDLLARYSDVAQLLGLPFSVPRARPPRRPKRRGPAAAYQLKITLKGSKPPIWRRLLLRSDTPLPEVSDVLLAAMGWQNYHLHQFVVAGEYIGVPDEDDWTEVTDEAKLRLDQIAPAVGSRFDFEYDFGDSWEHQVLLEKVLPLEPGGTYPRCVTGRRACPPEDVGGLWGFYDSFLAAIRDPAHPEHAEYLEWAGGAFDPDAFDLDEANAAIRAAAGLPPDVPAPPPPA